MMDIYHFKRLKSFFFCIFLIVLFTWPSSVFAADVTDSIQLNKSRGVYDRRSGEYSFDVTLQNISGESFSEPIYVVIKNISPDTVTVSNSDGTDSSGNPKFDYSGYFGDGVLDPGETSQPKRWAFYNSNNVRFSYDVQVITEGASSETDPPLISITNPVHNGVISTASPLITIVYSDEGSGINQNSLAILINGTDSTNLFTISETKASCKLINPLSTGANQVSVTIEDNEGNSASAVCDFTVGSSGNSIKYLFSLKGNDWIFGSPGDGTYAEYASSADLGISTISDLISVSRPYPAGDVYFSKKDMGGILQSPLNDTFFSYLENSELGLAQGDRIAGNHFGFDGSVVFSVEGASNIYQSFGTGSFQTFVQNSQLGIGSTDAIECLHVGYDGTTYFCYSENEGVFHSSNDGTFAQYLTPEALGVPGSSLDAFATMPETTPPTLSITNPADGAFLNDTTPNITIVYQDSDSGIDSSSFYARLNGSDVSKLFTVTETGASYQIPDGSELPVGDNSLYVRVRDMVGNESESTSDFKVGVFRAIPGATPVSGPAPLTVYFTTDGEDPAGTIQRFRWDFDGNGSYDTYDEIARDYNHTYSTPGTYNATLHIWSSTGATTSASIPITVQNNPPTANADIVPSNGEVPLTAQLIGSGSDPDGSIVLYEWDFEGDGTYDWSSSTTGNTTYTYASVGTYQAAFRVTDNDGQTATALAATTVVNTGPPGSPTATASANPTSGNAPLNVNFTGTATDPNNDMVLYEWDFEGDGIYDWSSATSGVTTYTYTRAGTHVAKLRVTDSTGLTGIDQTPITVNIQPGLSIQNDTVGFLGGGMTASASSQYSSTYSPSKAIDGQTNTYWYTARYYTPYYNRATWFEVSFSQPQLLAGLSVRWHSTSYMMSRARIGVYDLSDNLVYTRENDLSGNPSIINLPAIENVKKIRLTAITAPNRYYVIISEFEPQSSPMPGSEANPTGSNINTSISADSQVTILIKNDRGQVVRTLVNNEQRTLGNHSDYWNCRDDSGAVVSDGAYYAVMQYLVDGQVKTLDLTKTTGGGRYNPPRLNTGGSTSNPLVFEPFEDEFLPVNFTLSRASEVTLFVGILYTTDTRIKTVINRMPLPAGSHTIYWDGTDDNGNIAEPPLGNMFVLGIWGYYLPDNAMFMTGGKPVISDVSADPNYFSPFSEKCDTSGNGEGIVLTYGLSEDAETVELRAYSLETGNLLRTAIQNNISAGENTFFWDGKNNNDEYVDIGDYQLGLIATDRDGNKSMLKYALTRIDY